MTGLFRSPHTLIAASAGSGKTFKLSSRYVQLVREGHAPSSILASTFTRFAAGEIRDRILARLARAVVDPGERELLGTSIGADVFGVGDARGLLRQVVDQLGALQVRTLDSFFAGVVRSFALELGLSSDLTFIEPEEEANLRREAIADALAGPDHGRIAASLAALTKRDANRAVCASLDEIVQDLGPIYRQTTPEVWTWMEKRPTLDRAGVRSALARLARLEPSRPAHAKPRDKDVQDAAAFDVQDMDAWVDWTKTGLVKQVMAAAPGAAPVFRKHEIDPDIVAAYGPLVDHVGALVWNHLEWRTGATEYLLARVREGMDRAKARRHGMTFEDLTYHMTAALEHHELDLVLYRLDAWLHHMLLDEFQDTSVAQWRALEPIAREITSFGTGERTLFCVGDVKQSIYGWRDAAPEILGGLPVLLQPAELHKEQLTTSYRSVQEVIDTVNDVFRSPTTNPALEGVESAAVFFEHVFEPHTTKASGAGFAALHVVPKGTAVEHAVERAAALYREQPERSVGVLVRTNARAGDVLNGLHGLSVPATGRGGAEMTDAAPVNTMLDALRLAEHPDDKIAAFHIASGPLSAAMDWTNLTAPANAKDEHAARDAAGRRRHVSRMIRRALIDDGYALTLHRWIDAIGASADEREHRRLVQLIGLADRFDERAGLRPGAFVDIVLASRVDDPGVGGVKVMNIHQSKGMEFDVVLLPQLDEKIAETRRQLVALEREPAGRITRAVRWIETAARNAVPDLESLFGDHIFRLAREDLCLLYVALTRAKRGLEMYVDPPPKKGASRTLASMLTHALAETPYAIPNRVDELMTVYTHGDPVNLRSDVTALVAAPPFGPPPHLDIVDAGRSTRAGSAAPTRGGADSASAALGGIDRDAAERGTALHALFESVAWVQTYRDDAAARRAIVASVCPSRDAAWQDRVLETFRVSLDAEPVRSALSRPGPHARVWRELPFLHDGPGGTVRNGTIDRLVAVDDASGRAERAMVYDFKTGHVAAPDAGVHAERYRGQLEAYRDAASRLLDLDPAQIETAIVFVTSGLAIPGHRSVAESGA